VRVMPVGIGADRLAIRGHRTLAVAAREEEVPELRMGVREIGLEADRLAALRHRLLPESRPVERDGKILVTLRVAGLEAEALAERRDRGFEIPFFRSAAARFPCAMASLGSRRIASRDAAIDASIRPAS